MDRQEGGRAAISVVQSAMAPAGKIDASVLDSTQATNSSSVAANSASSAPRPHYVPQFSAATQMILQRIGKPGSFSSAIASSSAISRDIEPSAFQDAKRRLVMNLNTSLTMPMPAPPKSQQATAASLPMNDAFQLRTPSLGKPPASANSSAKTLPLPTKQIATKTKPTKPTHTRTASKRKRPEAEDDVESPASSNFSQDGTSRVARLPEPPSPAPATITKSGRQILKPTTYNPNTVAAAQAAAIQQNSSKRKHWGKRTAEQALCKVCTRGLSPLKNQVVFCDGCNLCWHQLCHEPYIDDAFVSDETKSWFCSKCTAKRERHLAKKKTIDGFKGVSWSAKSADQRRTYLASLPAAQLVNLVMYSLELHPDLPLFPSNESAKRTTSAATSGAMSALPHSNTRGTSTDMSPRGPTQYSRKFSTPDQATKPTKSNTATDQSAREESEDSVPPAWPKSGQGILSHMSLDEDDFQDKNDFEAFSLTTYNDRGRKIIENGLSV